MELTSQTRTNAAISYFFLGPLLLLARNNPNFSHPYVRSHAKTATTTIFWYAAAIGIYWYLLADLLSFNLPLVPVTADRVVTGTLFALLTFALIRGANRARLGLEPASVLDLPVFRFAKSDLPDESAQLSETDRTLALWSFVPVLGIFFALRNPSRHSVLGMRAGSLAFVLYATLFVAGGDASLMGLTLLYAGFFVTVGVTLFTTGKVPVESALSLIPSMETAYRLVRTVPGFILETFRVSFGKGGELSFVGSYARLREKDAAYESAMEAAFPDSKFPIAPEFAAFPVLNLILAPRLFSSSPYRYAVAVGQGVAMTAIYAALTYVFEFSNPYQIWLLPAVMLLLGGVRKRPFYRVPVLSECYWAVGFATFGLFNRARHIRETAKKESAVSFKIDGNAVAKPQA